MYVEQLKASFIVWIIQPNIRMRAWHHSVSACARLCVSRPESKIAEITQHVREDRSIIFFFYFLFEFPFYTSACCYFIHFVFYLRSPLQLTLTCHHSQKKSWHEMSERRANLPPCFADRSFLVVAYWLRFVSVGNALFFSFFYLNYKSARANVVRMRRCAVLLINNTHTPSLSNAAAAASLLPAVVTEADTCLQSWVYCVHLNHLLNAWPSPQATKPLCPTSCFPSCFGSFKQRLSVLVSRMGSTFVSAYAPASRMCVEGRKMLSNIQELNSLVGVEGVGGCIFVRVCGWFPTRIVVSCMMFPISVV